MVRKNTPMYVADTENTVPREHLYELDEDASRNVVTSDHVQQAADELDKARRTRIWAGAIAPVIENPCEDDVVIVNNMRNFIYELSQIKNNAVVFFHNLAYDGTLILSYLLKNGYKIDNEQPADYVGEEAWQFVRPYRGRIKTLISGDGAFYQITLTFKNNGRTIKLRDSLKLLPFSVDAIGDSFKTKAKKLKGGIDYAELRPHNHQITDQERAYIINDVLVMSEAIHKLKSGAADLTKFLTIGSACMKNFEEGANPAKKTRSYEPGASRTPRTDILMPDLDPELDAELRRAYRGGFCYVNRQNPMICNNQAIDLTESPVNGYTYDVNSLYPSVMVDKVMPIGEPVTITDMETISDFDFYGVRPYFIKFTAAFSVKPDHIPFIQLKGNGLYAENEYVRDTHGEREEITLTGVDFRMFLDHYDIQDIEIAKLWVFDHTTTLFNDYIRFWFNVKDNADNPVDYMIAKLMLNNLYGKTAQAPERESGNPYLDDKGILRIDSVQDTAGGGYIPIGAYITAYAREVTVRAAQANYDNFLYADTDSMHLYGPAVGIEVGKALGEWDHEATWDMARFVRQKTYIERVIEEERKNADGVKEFGPVTPHIIIRAAGATELVKERLQRRVSYFDAAEGAWRFALLNKDGNDEFTAALRSDREVFERFTFGLSEAGKLTREAVSGGVWLRETTWGIAGGDEYHKDPLTGLAQTEWTVLQ